MNSASRAGQLIGVSETTIIRFSHQLGYSGYREFQEEVQRKLFDKSSLSVYLESKKIDHTAKNPIKNLMFNNIKAIHEVIEGISETKFEAVVNKLSNANKIITCGSQASQAFASWFAFALDLVRGNTRLYQFNVDNILLRASELSVNDVVVSFSFHRYAIDTIQFAKLAKLEGAYVISFTDSPFSPITEHADLIIPVHLQVKSTLDVASVIFTILNGIISAISIRRKEDFQKRIKYFDSMEADGLFAQSFLDGES